MNCSPLQKVQWKIKRIVEWLLALVLLLLTAPVQLLIALAIKLDSSGPVLFVQHRLGRGGEPFKLFKFRTLAWQPGASRVFNEDGSTRVLKNDPRLTRVGSWLRSGWDELPQLANVLKGEMALVGPRPDELFHRQFYTPQEERKLSVLPGITGLPQASGRNDIPWKQRILMDLYYIDNYTLALDLRIVALTIFVLLGRSPAANTKSWKYPAP